VRRGYDEAYRMAGIEANGKVSHLPGRPESAVNLTDLGNAERLVAHHGADLRYVYAWEKWLVWDGRVWKVDDTGEVERRAKAAVRSIYAEAASAEDADTRKALASHAKSSEARGRIEAMISLARSEPGIAISPEELDADPWALTTPNGTLDLRAGELHAHRREDHITKASPVEYDPDAVAPTWSAFLERILPGEELRAFVQRAVGYSATGDTSEQCMMINHGPGANGKSTFQEAIAATLGDYAMRAPTEMLLAKHSSGIPNDVARLKGARFVSASETEEGRRLAEPLVKDLTGQDTITARFMRAEWFEFRPTHKLWLSTNHKPEIRGTDAAIWRRIRLVPWAVTIPPAERDKKLLAKLREELPGILAWIVQGCLEWQREGLRPPTEVRRATGKYRAEMDVLAAFIDEECVVSEHATASAKALYSAYRSWCEEYGEKVESQRRFGGRLKERGFENGKITAGPHKGNVEWYGIGLAGGSEGPPDDGGSGQRSTNHPPQKDPQNADKGHSGQENGGGSGPELDINARKNTSRGVIEEKGPLYPLPPPEGQKASRERRLAPDEAEEVKRLIGQGMKADLARGAVLRKRDGGTA
jgi:putative DNA primase/helicase